MDFQLHPKLAADTVFIKNLRLCSVLLMNDERFPWVILVPQKIGMREMTDLLPGEQALLMEEISKVSRAMKSLFSAEKMNIAALGNVVPQLHVHVIARHSKDDAWPNPVWGQGERMLYADAELMARCQMLSEKI